MVVLIIEKLNWKFIKQIIELIDNHNIYSTRLIQKDYISNVLNMRSDQVSEKEKKRLNYQISKKIFSLLLELNLTKRYSSHGYKNLSKGNLFNEFDKRLREKYLIIDVRK